MKYKPGDKVRVKSLGQILKNYSIDPEMEKYCGRIMTIKKVLEYPDGYYLLEESGFNCVWPERTLAGLIKEELSFKEAAELYKQICNKYTCDNCPLGETQNECVSSFIEYSDEMQEALLKWKNEHKTKTNREKFIEIFGEEVFRNHTHQLNSFWQEEYKEE